MSQGAAVWLVLLVAVVAANLPFVSERRFIVGPRGTPKSLGFRVLELLLLYLLTLGLGFAIEARIGQRQPQGWEFYAAFGCFFVTLAFPGFVWRYLRRGRRGR
jgi:hypothetical protein